MLVSEYGLETVTVTKSSTVHSKASTTWAELVETVRMWRNRYPNQHFYIVEGRQPIVNTLTLAAVRVIAGECQRQQTTPDRVGMLAEAYTILRDGSLFSLGRAIPSLGDISAIARIVEPTNGGKYRSVPATFANLTSSIAAGSISNAMDSWWNYYFVPFSKGTTHDVSVDEVTKEFLDIHPFTDGNGRMAFLLQTYLLGNWDNPVPLTDHYATDK